MTTGNGSYTTRVRDAKVDCVAFFLKAHAGLWVHSDELMLVGGKNAWRTRVSDCRLQRGMRIENRQYRKGGAVVSEYRYTPEAA